VQGVQRSGNAFVQVDFPQALSAKNRASRLSTPQLLGNPMLPLAYGMIERAQACRSCGDRVRLFIRYSYQKLHQNFALLRSPSVLTGVSRGESVRIFRRSGIGALQPVADDAAYGRRCEGFRMPARRNLSTRAEGRRPKASREGTRGGRHGRWASMAI
jgi:hypothetical protein